MQPTWSLRVHDTDTGEVLLEENPDQLLPTASIGKLYLLVEVATRIDAGTLDLGQMLDRRTTHMIDDSGLWQHLHEDEISLETAASLVGAVSDNLATNALVDTVGIDAVRERARSLAPGGSHLSGHVRRNRGPQDPAELSMGCAADLTALMTALHRGSEIPGPIAGRVMRWLALSHDLSMVARAFELDPLAHTEEDLGLLCWNKTGTDSAVRADVGVVAGPVRTITYAALCHDQALGTSRLARRACYARMEQIGQMVAAAAGA